MPKAGSSNITWAADEATWVTGAWNFGGHVQKTPSVGDAVHPVAKPHFNNKDSAASPSINQLFVFLVKMQLNYAQKVFSETQSSENVPEELIFIYEGALLIYLIRLIRHIRHINLRILFISFSLRRFHRNHRAHSIRLLEE